MLASPSFKVAKNAFRYIKDASLDIDFYTNYLHRRNIPEEEFSKLQIAIDDKYISSGAHGIYIARDRSDQDSQHIIGLSPSRMPSSIKKQGRTFRHETEHFIYQIHHPNHLRNRIILIAGATAVGGSMGAALGIEAGINMSHSLPLAAEIPIDSLIGTAGAALGSLSAFLPACMGHIAFGSSEIQAEWAEHRRKAELPNGILQVEFV